MKKAIQRQDIVISTIGNTNLDIKTENIVEAIQKLKVQRFIAISADGIYNELAKAFNEWNKQLINTP